MKKKLIMFLIVALAVFALVGCSGEQVPADSSEGEPVEGDGFDPTSEIGVTSRESGSGTRGAFIELVGIEKQDENDEKIDYTTPTAVETNSTSVMMTTVAGDLYSIGYISLGSLNKTIKALKVDGVEATIENIQDGSYTIARPFNIATMGGISENAQDFIDFIMSADGQAVVEDSGYIPVSDAPEYSGSMSSGKVVLAGSSSITPVMENLREAYLEINPDVDIEVQQSDSSTGMTSATDGIADIGMASREVRDSEIEAGLTPLVIAMDGIALIVNNDNPVTGLTTEQVMKVFTGELTAWSELID